MTVTVGLLGAVQQPARATAGGRLVSSSPAAGSRLASAPSSVHLQFSLWLTHDSWITVTGPDGLVTSGTPRIVGGSADQGLPTRLPNGDYTVVYYADFGLLGSATGTVDFAVGPAPTATTPRTSPPGTGTPSRTATPRTTPRRTATATPTTPSAAAGSPTSTGPGGTTSTTAGRPAGDVPRGQELVALGSSGASGGDRGSGGGFPWPPPLVLAGLGLAAAAFGADRWRTVRHDRAQVRRVAAQAPPAASKG